MSVAAAKSRVSVNAWVMSKWPYRFDCSRDGIRRKFCWQFQVLQKKSLPVDEDLSTCTPQTKTRSGDAQPGPSQDPSLGNHDCELAGRRKGDDSTPDAHQLRGVIES